MRCRLTCARSSRGAATAWCRRSARCSVSAAPSSSTAWMTGTLAPPTIARTEAPSAYSRGSVGLVRGAVPLERHRGTRRALDGERRVLEVERAGVEDQLLEDAVGVGRVGLAQLGDEHV